MDEILWLAFISVFAKLIEDCRKIELSRKLPRRLKNYHGIYEVFNVHMGICLAVFAALLTANANRNVLLCTLFVVLLGVASKGVFSDHRPETLFWSDNDARYGLLIPNGCAIACVGIGLYFFSDVPAVVASYCPFEFVSTIALAAIGVTFGVAGSWLFTLGAVRLLASKVDDKAKIRAHASTVLSVLLTKGVSAKLTPEEIEHLRSSLMSYFMTTNSQRIAKGYLRKLQVIAPDVGLDLYAETERLFHERFPLT